MNCFSYLENFFGYTFFLFFFLFQFAFFRCGNFCFLFDHIVENGLALVDDALGSDDWVFADLKTQIATVEITDLKDFCFISQPKQSFKNSNF